jgi:Transposase DDE domain group 1
VCIDLDATIVIAHSEKQHAAPTFKGSFGYHPMLATRDNTGEFLAGLLRPGNSGANTAVDHIAVLDQALAQLPDAHRHGTPILVRADTAGSSKAFLAHVHALRERGVDLEFSVGWRTDRLHDVIAAIPAPAWTAAVASDGEPVDTAQVCELTGLPSPAVLADYPTGMRIIVRREHPHPGAQLDLLEQRDGWRYTAFATTTQNGQLAHLDARHRAHARVEDRIRCAKDTGLGRFPSRDFAINRAWLTAVMIAVDLVAWAQTLLLHDNPALAKAEPKRCATGCCTSPPGSPEDNGASGCASTGTGAGPTTSLEHSPDSPRCRNPSPALTTPSRRPGPRSTRQRGRPGDQHRPISQTVPTEINTGERDHELSSPE